MKKSYYICSIIIIFSAFLLYAQYDTNTTRIRALKILAQNADQFTPEELIFLTDFLAEDTIQSEDVKKALALRPTQTKAAALAGFVRDSGNTAAGSNALKTLKAAKAVGSANSAFGTSALTNAVTNANNTALGFSALASSTTGNGNTATGTKALLANTSGNVNTAIGTHALVRSTSGTDNIALGYKSGFALTTANSTISIGHYGVNSESNAIRIGTVGKHNKTYLAGTTQITGGLVVTGSSTNVGNISNLGAMDLTGTMTIGQSVYLPSSSEAKGTVYIGNFPFVHGFGGYNAFVGPNAGNFTTNSAQNVGAGGYSLRHNTTGNFNAALGFGALSGNTSGNGNIGIGNYGGINLTNGDYNVYIAHPGVPTENKTIHIGTPNWHAQTFIAGAVQLNEDLTVIGSTHIVSGLDVNGSATINQNIYLPISTTTKGALHINNERFLHGSGTYNTFVGPSAGNTITSGTNNTGVGTAALFATTRGIDNTALGGASLLNNTTGSQNTASGTCSLLFNDTGNHNTAMGNQTLASNNTGSKNTALGSQALINTLIGSHNIAVGYQAGFDIRYGSSTISIGSTGRGIDESNAIYLGTTGVHAKTYIAGDTRVSGSTIHVGRVIAQTHCDTYGNMHNHAHLTVTGSTHLLEGLDVQGTATLGQSIYLPATTGAKGAVYIGNIPFVHGFGGYNTFTGANAGNFTTDSAQNTGIGSYSMRSNTTGSNNATLGFGSLGGNTSGSSNIAIGNYAGANYTTGSNNICLAHPGVAAESATTRIGTPGTHLNTYLAGSTQIVGGLTVTGSSTHLVGTLDVNGSATYGQNIYLPITTHSKGALYINNERFIHGYGGYNTFVGPSAGNTSVSGWSNTGIGAASLYSNRSGNNNTAIGGAAQINNTTGSNNTSLGFATLNSNWYGNNNTAIGSNALIYNDTGTSNIALGCNAGMNMTTGSSNITIGHYGIDGENNTIRIGIPSTHTRAFLAGNTQINGGLTVTGTYGRLLGSLDVNGTATLGQSIYLAGTTKSKGTIFLGNFPFIHGFGGYNAFVGNSAGNFTTSGTQNSGMGTYALTGNTSGSSNSALGFGSLSNNTSGSNNIGIGDYAGNNLTTGSNNICIGNRGVTAQDGTTRIGTPGTHLTTYLAGSTQIVGGLTVTGSSTHLVGTLDTNGTATLGQCIYLPTTTKAKGSIYIGGMPFVHGFGGYNTFIGGSAGNFTTNSSQNTGVGAYAISTNTTGNNNAALGFGSLGGNTSGSSNIAIGNYAGTNYTTGSNNICLAHPGVAAESSTTRIGTPGTHLNTYLAGSTQIVGGLTVTGSSTHLVGALDVNGSATVGQNFYLPLTTATKGSLFLNNQRFMHSYGSYNTFAGSSAGNVVMSGTSNTGFGASTLLANSSGENNTAIGGAALLSNTTGSHNTATGFAALNTNAMGICNTAHGDSALIANLSGNMNTAVGTYALKNNTMGSCNIALGYNAGLALTTGGSNITIGHLGISGDEKTIRIGNSSHTKCFMGGIRGVTTDTGDAINVLVDSNGQLGTVSSSRRYKENIADINDDATKLTSLKPVSFTYKDQTNNKAHYGFIAEDVAEVYPDLVIYKNGQPETVAYHEFPALLIAGYKQQQTMLHTHETTIDALLKRVNELESAIRGT